MPDWLNLGEVASDLVDSIGDAADSLFTSDEEREKVSLLMEKVDARIRKRLLDLKGKMIEARGTAVHKEIAGSSWLQRNWRPISMLVFVGVIVGHWLGLAGMHLEPEVSMKLYGLVKLGLGGYVVLRSAEKMTPQLADAYKSRNSDSQ